MKKYIISTLFFLGIILLVIYYNTSTKVTPSLETKFISSNSASGKKTPLNTKPDRQKKETVPTSLHTKEDKTFKTVGQPSEEKIIYENISLDEAALKGQARKNITPIAAIRMIDHPVGTLQPNDTILIPDIEGIDYPIHITDVKKHSDGSVTTTGSYNDEGIKYTTTITRSQKESFINLSTAQGSYEIETRKGVGYIYKTQSIRRQMHNTNLNDRIVLPLPKAR